MVWVGINVACECMKGRVLVGVLMPGRGDGDEMRVLNRGAALLAIGHGRKE